MKKLTTILLLFWAIIGFLYAQSPYLINYQVVLRDAGGNLITTSQNIGIAITDSVGTTLYSETFIGVIPTSYGIVNLKIGSSTNHVGNFNMIDWSKGQKFVQLSLGGAPVGMPSQLVSVPFALHASNGVPPGSIMAYGGDKNKIPDGWLLCDGAVKPVAQYQALYNAIGTQFGSGSGVGTFHLPDFRGRFLRGMDNGTGRDFDVGSRLPMNSGGLSNDNVGSVQGYATHLPVSTSFSGITSTDGSHQHNLVLYTDDWFQNGGSDEALDNDAVGANGTYSKLTDAAGAHSHTVQINSGGDNETRPINANVLYIIKY